MYRFKFSPDDLFVNRLKTYPEYDILVYQGQMYSNKESRISGSGGIVVYDTNTNRTGSNLIYPFVMTGSQKNVFKKYKYQPLVQNNSGHNQFTSKYWLEASGGLAESAATIAVNGQITSSYGIESPIKRNRTARQNTYTANYYNVGESDQSLAFVTGETRDITDNNGNQFSINLTASALQNIAKKYSIMSEHFIFDELLTGSAADNINFITIPSMYYGSTIKKGSVELNYYITGSKVGTCSDKNHNGLLIETTGSSVDSVVGLVLYDEGVIMLTASHDLESNNIEYTSGTPASGSWLTYGTTLNDGESPSPTLSSASYGLYFQGTSYVNSMTMFAHAKKGHLNHSNNPTYRTQTSIGSAVLGSGSMFAETSYGINNIVSGSYVSASFEKTTYISKVHIYDEDGNLIAITSLAKPIKKTIEDEYTFKMKIDL